MTATGYIAARDALHTLIQTGVTGFLTTTNVTNNDDTVLDNGGIEYAAVLYKGDSVVSPAAPGYSAMIYEILIEQFARYKKMSTTLNNMELFTEALKARIEKNPTLLGTKGVIATGTLISAVDKPQGVIMQGVKSDNAPIVFLVSTMHVQIEYRYKIVGGEFR